MRPLLNAAQTGIGKRRGKAKEPGKRQQQPRPVIPMAPNDGKKNSRILRI